MKYFSYDQCGDFELHDTAEYARAAADKALDYCRDEAVDGWCEEVTQICWGEIKGEVVETERRPRTDADTCDPVCDEVVDYALVELN